YEVARRLAAAGDLVRAAQVVHSVGRPCDRARALAAMAQAAAASGDHGEARRLAVEAERAADAVTTPERREWALAGVVGALAAAGDAERAERIARGITDAEQR